MMNIAATTINASPNTPLGAKPHPRLYGHVGIAPISNSSNTINAIVPSVISVLLRYTFSLFASLATSCTPNARAIPFADEQMEIYFIDRERSGCDETSLGGYH